MDRPQTDQREIDVALFGELLEVLVHERLPDGRGRGVGIEIRFAVGALRQRIEGRERSRIVLPVVAQFGQHGVILRIAVEDEILLPDHRARRDIADELVGPLDDFVHIADARALHIGHIGPLVAQLLAPLEEPDEVVRVEEPLVRTDGHPVGSVAVLGLDLGAAPDERRRSSCPTYTRRSPDAGRKRSPCSFCSRC